MPEPASPESGPLSVEQAIESLVSEPVAQEENTAPEAPIEAAEGTEEPQGEPEAQQVAEDGAETPAEGEEGTADPEPEKLDPPLYWKPEAKEAFGKLDPVVQAEILAQEGPREAAAAKAKAEAAEKIQAAEAEMGKVQQLATGMAEKLPQWMQVFQSRWGTETPDWVAVAREHGTEQASLLKMQFEQESSALQEAARKTVEAEALAHTAFVKTEFAKLAEIAPDLADPDKGPTRRNEIVTHLAKLGFPQEALRRISAQEMTIAHKAMLYDQLQAAAAGKPKPKPAAPAPKATVRPSAAAPQSSSERSATQVANRFAQTRSVDDAVALLLAKG